MEDIQNKVEEPKENLQEEEKLLKETPLEEVKKSVIEKFGLNDEIDEELINKLTDQEILNRKQLATAIKQKITWRTKAEAQKEQKQEAKPQPVVIQPKNEDIEKIVDIKVRQSLEERELESLDLSDSFKEEIKNYAKASSMTIKQVLASDYFQFLKGKEEAKARVDEASAGGKRKAPIRSDMSSRSPQDFDLSTDEGRNEYEKWKEWRKSNLR